MASIKRRIQIQTCFIAQGFGGLDDRYIEQNKCILAVICRLIQNSIVRFRSLTLIMTCHQCNLLIFEIFYKL